MSVRPPRLLRETSAMKRIFCVVATHALVACKREDAHPAETEPDAFVMNAETRAMVQLHDCDVLRAGIEAGDQRLAEKAGSAYSAKAFEELAALRADLAREANGWSLGLEEDRKLAADWAAMNLRAAAAERRVAASLADAGAGDTGADAPTAESELGALAKDEDKVFTDLHKLCPKLATK